MIKCKCGKPIKSIDLKVEVVGYNDDRAIVRILEGSCLCRCGLKTYLTESEMKRLELAQ